MLRAALESRLGFVNRRTFWCAHGELGDQLGRAVGRLPVHHENFEPFRVVVLRDQLGKSAAR